MNNAKYAVLSNLHNNFFRVLFVRLWFLVKTKQVIVNYPIQKIAVLAVIIRLCTLVSKWTNIQNNTMIDAKCSVQPCASQS